MALSEEEKKAAFAEATELLEAWGRVSHAMNQPFDVYDVGEDGWLLFVQEISEHLSRHFAGMEPADLFAVAFSMGACFAPELTRKEPSDG